jgi:hypothetical protein
MKITSIIFFSFFTSLQVSSQSSSWGNPDYTSFESKFLAKIDTVPINQNAFEIRLWFNDGRREINTTSFISLTREKNNWKANYYTFISYPRQNDSIKVDKKKAVRLNYDSLYRHLIKDGLFKLNSDTINELMEKKGQFSWMWVDSGPTNYTVQIVTNQKTLTANLKCPRHFYYEAKIEEFGIPLKVISSILKLIGVNEPC